MFGFFRKKPVLPPPAEVAEKLRHIAFIMDGNGRWAQKRALPRKAGHVEGAKNFKKVIRHCRDIGIRTVTVYAFSTENWQRPDDEVEALMRLFDEYMESSLNSCLENSIRIVFLGSKERYPESLRLKAERMEEATRDGFYTLNIALNYGGRDEIVHAANACIREGKTVITKEDLSSHMYTAASPDPDLVVRTGGDLRISNFLLWQSAYAEYYFTDTLWPDLEAEEIDQMVAAFLGRKRRFGKIK